MVMNSKGQTAILGLMIGVFVFMMAMVFIDPLKDVISEARGTSQLDCSNSSISDGTKATCLLVDIILPYFIAVVLAIAGAWIGAKIFV
jgi:hypothetical protein